MKDKLRELAAECRKPYPEGAHGTRYADGYNDAGNDIADRLDSILDAEGDGGVVGEKVCIDAVGRVEMDMTGDIGINWVLEGGIHALEEGTWILCADREITDDEGYGELYTRPARSGVVSDEDVEAACCKYYNCGHPVYPPVFEGIRAALEHFAKGERHER